MHSLNATKPSKSLSARFVGELAAEETAASTPPCTPKAWPRICKHLIHVRVHTLSHPRGWTEVQSAQMHAARNTTNSTTCACTKLLPKVLACGEPLFLDDGCCSTSNIKHVFAVLVICLPRAIIALLPTPHPARELAVIVRVHPLHEGGREAGPLELEQVPPPVLQRDLGTQREGSEDVGVRESCSLEGLKHRTVPSLLSENRQARLLVTGLLTRECSCTCNFKPSGVWQIMHMSNLCMQAKEQAKAPLACMP